MLSKIAALFVQERGIYAGRADIDAWPESRDARLYKGPYPVIAHPPCARWCRLAALVEKRWGHKRGDDGGCFESALSSVRTYGGVLEHPAFSLAWKRFDLPRPDRYGGWSAPDDLGGRSCHVEQGRYGHRAKKATWLYAVGTLFPRLRWGSLHDHSSISAISWCGNVKGAEGKYLALRKGAPQAENARTRITKKEASSTPPEFLAVLLDLARSADWLK